MILQVKDWQDREGHNEHIQTLQYDAKEWLVHFSLYFS